MDWIQEGDITKKFKSLLENNRNFSKQEIKTLTQESKDILMELGQPTKSKHNKTGLVIGYVQSGKTTSYEQLMCLAGDNGYRLVILLPGTTKILLNQAFERIKKELGVGEHFRLAVLNNPDLSNEQQIIGYLNDPEKLIIIVAMKHHNRIQNVVELMNTPSIFNLIKKYPTMIIDDEADQASMNTFARSNSARGHERTSTTYKNLFGLRVSRALKNNHCYVQYTATPQGPMLITLDDILSPDFASVITPGENYLGGKEFFGDEYKKYFLEIPFEDLEALDLNAKKHFIAPPPSLQDAMDYFFIGVVDGLLNNYESGNRSMIVHPHIQIRFHDQYAIWVQRRIDLLSEILSTNNGKDFDALSSSLRQKYDLLRQTHPKMKSFNQIIRAFPGAVQKTIPTIVNQTNNEVLWDNAYSHILIGGACLDRGFTVKGLTVTYMPRSLGVGNADTIQQRCRFFGYKKEYSGLCRVFLPLDSLFAYRDYVFHEEDIREKVINIMKNGRADFKEFLREFILPETINRPTRLNILGGSYYTSHLKGWKFLQTLPSINDRTKRNNKVIDALIKSNKKYFNESSFSGKTDDTRHEDCSISVKLFLKLLEELQFEDLKDINTKTDIRYALKILYERGVKNLLCVNMGSGKVRFRGSSKRFDRQSLQGATYNNLRIKTYDGDGKAIEKDRLTLQIHHVSPARGKNEKISVLAFHIPTNYGTRIFGME